MDAFNALLAQLATLSNKIANLEVQTQARAQFGQAMHGEWCGHAYATDQCPSHLESVNYYGKFNQNQNNLLSNVYNPSWRNHPNFGWSNNQFAGPMPQTPLRFQAHAHNILQQPVEQKFSMEEMFM